MISGRQIRAARALLGIKQSDLAKDAGISVIAIKNIERGLSDPRQSTITAIERVFKNNGVVFLDPNGGGEGVRFRE
jgi:predicted transcriptional regulator